MSAIEKFEVDGLTVKVYQDDDISNPRTLFDNAATLVAWHPRYELGDENIKVPEPGSLESEVTGRYKAEEWLRMYLYDHSGLRVSTSDFGDPWDSGQVGFIFMTADNIKREYGEVNDETREKARQLMHSEVEVLDQYLSGDVYGYVIETAEGEHVDSLWGMYGYDYAVKEAREAAESAAKRLREEQAAEAQEAAFWAARGVPTQPSEEVTIDR